MTSFGRRQHRIPRFSVYLVFSIFVLILSVFVVGPGFAAADDSIPAAASGSVVLNPGTSDSGAQPVASAPAPDTASVSSPDCKCKPPKPTPTDDHDCKCKSPTPTTDHDCKCKTPTPTSDHDCKCKTPTPTPTNDHDCKCKTHTATATKTPGGLTSTPTPTNTPGGPSTNTPTSTPTNHPKPPQSSSSTPTSTPPTNIVGPPNVVGGVQASFVPPGTTPSGGSTGGQGPGVGPITKITILPKTGVDDLGTVLTLAIGALAAGFTARRFSRRE